MARPQISMRKFKELEKSREEQRTVFLQSINTKEDFERELAPIVATFNSTPQDKWTPESNAAYKRIKSILMRGHQILEPDDYWEAVDSVEMSRNEALELVNEEIRERAANAVNQPFIDYLDEIRQRMAKVKRELMADKLNEDIASLKCRILYVEFQVVIAAWKQKNINPLPGSPSLPELYEGLYKSMLFGLDQDK